AARRPAVWRGRRAGRFRQRPYGGRARPGRGGRRDRGVARPPVRARQGAGPEPQVRRDGPRARRRARRRRRAAGARRLRLGGVRRGSGQLPGGLLPLRADATGASRMSGIASTSDETLLELRSVAVGVAREAGDMLADRAGQVEVAATKSSPTDVVTEMDRRSEELIRARILATRPADAILGEEGGQTGDADGAPVRWVIDPLDGTVNYLYGLHDWAVSIAAEVGWAEGGAEDGEVGGEVGRRIVAGAVFVPMRGEMFS